MTRKRLRMHIQALTWPVSILHILEHPKPTLFAGPRSSQHKGIDFAHAIEKKSGMVGEDPN